MTQSFDYFLHGWDLYLRFSKKANAEARKAYQLAIDLDSSGELPRARADLAYSLLHAWFFSWDDKVTIEQVTAAADAALIKDDYYSQWIRASVYLYDRQSDPDYTKTEAAYEEARRLAEDEKQAIPPDLQAFRVDRAEMWLLTGRAADAVPEILDAIAKTPVPEKWFYWVLSWAYYENNQWPEALAAIRHNISTPRNAMRKNVVASLVSLGPSFLEEAEDEAKLFLDEQASQGITYNSLNEFLDLENKVPFSDPSRLANWRNRLAEAFKKHLP